MITVNLLPKELRKRKIEIPDISFLPIIGTLFGIIIAVHLLLALTINVKARTQRRLEAKWQQIQPDKKKADAVISELKTMRAKIEAIDKLIQGRMSWAKKLNDLSDAVIPGVWLNRLWIERKVTYAKQEGRGRAEAEKITVKTLHLNGDVIAAGGEGTAAVGNFMRSLKNNSGFFADFSEVESAYIQQTKLKDAEVMDFELVCYFK